LGCRSATQKKGRIIEAASVSSALRAPIGPRNPFLICGRRAWLVDLPLPASTIRGAENSLRGNGINFEGANEPDD